MTTSNKGRASILLSPQTRDILKNLGHKGQTYDSILQELLKKANGNKKSS